MLKSTAAIVLALLVCASFTSASARQAPAAGAQPSIPDSNQASDGHRPRMLVMHGNISLYQGRSVAQVDADLRAAAEAQGYEPVVTPAGSSSREQEQWARARIAKGDIKAVMGFSMGGYTTERLKAAPGKGAESIRSYERLGAEFDPRTGAVRGDDPRFPGVPHMDLPAERARRAREQAAAHGVATVPVRRGVDARLRGHDGVRSPACRPGGIDSAACQVARAVRPMIRLPLVTTRSPACRPSIAWIMLPLASPVLISRTSMVRSSCATQTRTALPS
jgi:hypothetical protein